MQMLSQPVWQEYGCAVGGAPHLWRFEWHAHHTDELIRASRKSVILRRARQEAVICWPEWISAIAAVARGEADSWSLVTHAGCRAIRLRPTAKNQFSRWSQFFLLASLTQPYSWSGPCSCKPMLHTWAAVECHKLSIALVGLDYIPCILSLTCARGLYVRAYLYVCRYCGHHINYKATMQNVCFSNFPPIWDFDFAFSMSWSLWSSNMEGDKNIRRKHKSCKQSFFHALLLCKPINALK